MPTLIKTDSPDILLVDSEHAVYRAFFAHPELKTSHNILSGAFYGFLSIIKTQLNRLAPKEIIFVWGGGKQSGTIRRQIYSNYKAGRKHYPTLYSQLCDLQRFFSCIGYRQTYNNTGYEADDVIATIANIESKGGVKITILSGDHDFHQLVSPNVSVLAPGNSKRPDVLYNEQKIMERYGLPASQLADLFTLIGDSSDEIHGVPSIGEKTATKILLENGPIKQWVAGIENMHATPKQQELLKSYRQQLIINKRLISLKNANVEILDIPPINDLNCAKDVLDSYEIKKFKIEDFV